jgi:hypothetical protein
MNFVVSVRGPVPADLARKLAEAHVAAIKATQTRRAPRRGSPPQEVKRVSDADPTTPV